MPVIGRLDGQVEEVIIKPVGRRHAPGETDAPGNEAARLMPARDEPRDTRPENRPDPPRRERRDDGELPVWLL